jgi:hypothetical protein
MPRLRRILLPLLAPVAIVSLAACGGGSSGDKTPAIGDEPTRAAGTPRVPGATEPVGGDDAPIDPELQAVQEKARTSRFTATYRTTGAAADDSGPGTLTIVKDGTARLRWATTAATDGKDVTTVFIETPDLSVTCLSEAGELGLVVGVDPSQGLCLGNPPADAASGGSLRDLFGGIDIADVTLLEKSKRTIAGREGTCYRTQDNVGGEVGTACITDDGILLYNSTEGDDAFEMEAQTVSSSVSDSDFELPYELKELPNLGG